MTKGKCQVCFQDNVDIDQNGVCGFTECQMWFRKITLNISEKEELEMEKVKIQREHKKEVENVRIG